jgi:four helix bundle protein
VGDVRLRGSKVQRRKVFMNKKGYHDLIVWQKSRELVKAVYELTEKFPYKETYGLTSQIRRAALSVVLNIVEGDRRNSRKEFLRFLDTADASLTEVEACLEIALDLKYLTLEEYEKIETSRKEIAKMLTSLIKSIKSYISS